jgi:low affinity Fe/Cu permease
MADRSSSSGPHAFFSDLSTLVAKWTGSHWALLVAAGLVLVSLSLFGVDITNIGISIVTLLMVFVLQNTQNRDSAALHLKLDEVVRVEPEARDEVRRAEEKPVHEITELYEKERDDQAVEADAIGPS